MLVMPRADVSLRQYLKVSGDSLDVAETLAILKDIADALWTSKARWCIAT